MAAIHPRLQTSERRFVLLGSNGEDLKKPFEKSWQETANYQCDDPKLAAHKGNYGVCGGYGDLHIIDCDDLARWEEMGVLLLIPATFTIESRPGHRQFYVTCKERFASCGLFDPEKTALNEQGKPEYVHIGDLKAGSKDGICGGQAVGPGCRHPSGSIYQVVVDAPIADVSRELLQSIISRFKTSKKINKGAEEPKRRKYEEKDPLDSLKVVDIMLPVGEKSRSGDELRGDHPVHGSTNGGNFVVNHVKNSWHCFRCNSGGGPALAIAVKHGIISCSDAGPNVLRGELFKAVLKVAREQGYINDEEKPKSEGPTVIDAIKALASVCDGAKSQDGMGFSKFHREANEDLIEKAVSGEELSPKEEKKAYAFLKHYKKQLKKLGVDYEQIGHIARDDGEGSENALADIGERIPVWIEEHHFKTVSDTKKIYHYEHGVYLDNGETILEALIEAEFSDSTNNKMVADIIGKVKRRTYTDRDLFNAGHVINVKNGLLDLETLQLRPHTPDYLSTAQLDVTYDPEAKAPKIAKFLREVAQAGDVALIEEIIGWLLWPDYHIHKAVMLVGPGRNGKGTLLRLITAFMGRKSISNVTLQDLVSDTFAKSDLYGKLANIGGDLPSKDLSDTSAFRNLTGGDDNRAQEKYRPAFNFRNKAKMIFSANVLPRSQDDTYAFYVRWILIGFSNRFVQDDGTADPDLDSKLQTPEEMSGLLNIALAGLQRLKANGWKFSYTKTAEDVEVMYKRNANPVFAFLMDECEAGGAADYIEKSVFFDRFKAYVKKHNLRPMSTTKFGELLKDQTEIPVSDFRPWVDHGDRPRCWAGVKFKTPLTKKEGNGEKSTKSAEKGQKPENKTASGGLQATPSILKPYSTNPQEENANEKRNNSKGGVEYKQTVAGMDCDPLIAVHSEERKEGELHKKTTEEEPAQVDTSKRIRVAAISEYGMNGWVDPAKVAHALKLPLPEVIVWLHANYEAFERPNSGGIGYRQRRAGEAKA